MKKILALLTVSVFAISLTTGCGCSKKEEKPTEDQPKEEVKVNTNEGVIKDQTVESFEMKQTSLIYENETTVLTTSVTNTSDKDEYLTEFIIKFEDATGNTLATLKGFVGDKIKAGETKVITSSIGEDLSSATKVTYTVSK